MGETMISAEHFIELDSILTPSRIRRAEPRHRGTLTLSRGWVNFATRMCVTQLSMSLILTIFALVLITELVSWIGKSVFLQFVRILAVQGFRDLTRPLHVGMDSISTGFRQKCSETSAGAKVRAPNEKSGTSADQRSGSICKMGQTSSER